MPVQAHDNYWILETEHTAYTFGLNKTGLLVHCYWGPRLPQPGDYPEPPDPPGWASFNAPSNLTQEEYPAYAGAKYTEPCLKATFADGVRDVVLAFDSAEVNGETLDVHLRDTHYPLRITLHYRVHPAYDLIERNVTAYNDGDTPIRLERIVSAQ